MIVPAIMFAVLGALCSAVGAQLQHTGVRAETQGNALRLRSLGSLARNRTWRIGFGVLFLCAVSQILALTFAPVTVVAPIVVLALPAIAVLNARAGRVRLDRTAWVAVGVTSLAVAAFVSLTAGASAETAIPPRAVLDAAQLVAAVSAALAILALMSRGVMRCVALSAAAGAAYGLVSVLVRDVTYTVRVAGLAELPWLSLAGVVAAFLIGSWFIQLGYASGPPDVVVGCQTALNPLVATALGMTLLGELAGAGAATLTALAACGALALAGVVVLARHHPDARLARRVTSSGVGSR